MENTSTEAPATRKHTWLRYLAIGASCAPLAVLSVLHTMGRTDHFGVLGKWYVLTPLAIASFFAWTLIEKTIERTSA